MAHATGWAFEFVTLRQHPQYLNMWGYVQYSRPLETRADLDLWAPTFLGGQFGEALLLGFAGPGASQDNATVMEQIAGYVGRGPAGNAFFQGAFNRAREIVQSRPEALRLVAETLIQRELLSQAEISQALTSLTE